MDIETTANIATGEGAVVETAAAPPLEKAAARQEGTAAPKQAASAEAQPRESIRRPSIAIAGVPERVKKDYNNREAWGPIRRSAGKILLTRTADGTNIFDFCIGWVIICNVVFMIAETDASQECAEYERCILPAPITIAGNVFLVIYTLEALLRMIVDQAMYIFIPWNILDLFIVLSGFLGLLLDSPESGKAAKKVQLLRIARVVRIVRVAKMLTKFQTLNNMIKGFAGAMAAMAWGFVLIILLTVIWSVLAVELMNRTNQDIYIDDPTNRCAVAFSSVYMSVLFFFQTLVAGDSWGQCALPLIDRMPLSFLVFAGALVCIQLGFTNLVLAVIVDKAAEARDANKEDQLKEVKAEQERSLQEWRTLMKRMDQDNSGSVTLEEIMDGFKEDDMRDRMHMMSIDEGDMDNLFHLIDVDDTGTLSYDEFVDTFHKAQTQDAQTYQMVMKLEISKIKYMLGKLMGNPDCMTPAPSVSPSQHGRINSRVKNLQDDPLHQSCPPPDLKEYGSGIALCVGESQVEAALCSATAPRQKLYQEQEQEEEEPTSPFCEELRCLRCSFETRLDDLAKEAATISTRLSSQGALLGAYVRSSQAAAGVALIEEPASAAASEHPAGVALIEEPASAAASEHPAGDVAAMGNHDGHSFRDVITGLAPGHADRRIAAAASPKLAASARPEDLVGLDLFCASLRV